MNYINSIFGLDTSRALQKKVSSSGCNGKVGRKARERSVYRVLLRVVNFSVFLVNLSIQFDHTVSQ